MAGSWQIISGRRYYVGDNGPETAVGSELPETMQARAGDDAMDGGAGDDAIDGGHGNDTLQGGEGNDILWDGSDLSGGAPGIIGHDSLHGGNGDDLLKFWSPDTGDFADGGAGTDTLEVRFNYGGLILPGNPPIVFTLLSGGSSVIKLNGINTVAVNNIEKLLFLGNSGNDIIGGGDLDDTIGGEAGDDVLRGNGGNDSLDSGTGQVNIFGGAGNDVASFDLSYAGTAILLRSGPVIGLSGFGVIRDVEILSSFKLGGGNDRVELAQAALASFSTGFGDDTVSAVGSVSVQTGYGADVLTLGDFGDGVDPGFGADVVYLGGGDDSLNYTSTGSRADTAPDIVYGEGGNDAIYTPAGDDFLDGGTGNDTLYGGGGVDRIFGGDGNDSIEGEGGADFIRGGAGNDRISTDKDFWTGTMPADADLALGEDGNDFLTGGVGADTLDGGAGDDSVSLGFEDSIPDVVRGGTGNDTLVLTGFSYASTQRLSVRIAGTTHVVLDAVTIGSAVSFEALQVAAFGAAGPGHSITGGALGDNVRTGNGDDYIVGNGGGDTLGDASYRGAETILGGDGNDALQVTLDKGDRLFGQAGDDTITAYGLYASDVLGAPGATRLDGGDGTDTLQLYGGGRGISFDGVRLKIEGVVIGTVVNFERIQFVGSALDERLDGSPEADVINLGSGADTGYGDAGADSIDGAAGNDLLYGEDGADTLNGGAGANTLYGGAGNDLLFLGADTLADVANGGAGFDTLIATGAGSAALTMTGSFPGAVSLLAGGATIMSLVGIDAINIVGGSGNDDLFGGNLGDTLDGGAGSDTLTGGLGEDLLISNNNQGPDSLDGGGGADLARINRGSSSSAFLFTLATPAIAQTLADGTIVVGIEQASFAGGSGNDSLLGGVLADTLSGGGGADSILGGNGNDSLEAGFGAGGDTIGGGAGNDTISSYVAGAHRFAGDSGTEDRLILWRSSDAAGFKVEFGLAGVQTLASGETLIGFESGDVRGGSGADTLIGGGLADRLAGNEGNDILAGGAGDDSITGDAGADSIAGGDNADTLSGGDGNDTVTGGADADIFRFGTLATNGVDLVDDFGALDLLRVSRSGFSTLLVVGVTPVLVSGATPAAPPGSAPAFLFDTDNGDLSFDGDGSGAGAPVLFVQLRDAGLPALLTAAQIVVE